MVKLEPYFGKTAQFPLETTIQVKKGDIIALTVPTWAPALALGFGNDTSWRASRAKKQCTTTSAQTHADADRHGRSVLLPVPDRASDLQRHADLDPLGRGCRAVAGAQRAAGTRSCASARRRRRRGSIRLPILRFLGFFAPAPPEGVAASSLGRSSCRRFRVLRWLRCRPMDLVAGFRSVEVVFVFVAVVEVDVVCPAAFSALVSFGGVMFGCALGHRVRDAAAAAAGRERAAGEQQRKPASDARASAQRAPPPAIRAAPCAGRRSGSR